MLLGVLICLPPFVVILRTARQTSRPADEAPHQHPPGLEIYLGKRWFGLDRRASLRPYLGRAGV